MVKPGEPTCGAAEQSLRLPREPKYHDFHTCVFMYYQEKKTSCSHFERRPVYRDNSLLFVGVIVNMKVLPLIHQARILLHSCAEKVGKQLIGSNKDLNSISEVI